MVDISGGIRGAVIMKNGVLYAWNGSDWGVVSLDALDATELGYLDAITPGVQAANKAVVPDDNVNSGIAKVTQLHIGATGAEVQVTATPAEINYLDKAAAVGVQEANKAVVADGNINTGVSKVTELHIGASGSEVQVTATPAEINTLYKNPGKKAFAHIDFNAAGTAAMNITIDGVVYLEADAEDFPNGVWTNGASAADSATSLIAAINGDTRATVDFTAVADASGDGLWLIYDAVGVNAGVISSSTGDATVSSFAGGAIAGQGQTVQISHLVTTNELLSGAIVIPCPFTPGTFMAQVRSATGLIKAVTDLFTISGDNIICTTDGATNAADTDTITVTVFA